MENTVLLKLRAIVTICTGNHLLELVQGILLVRWSQNKLVVFIGDRVLIELLRLSLGLYKILISRRAAIVITYKVNRTQLLDCLPELGAVKSLIRSVLIVKLHEGICHHLLHHTLLLLAL